jgi:hypothetical protein
MAIITSLAGIATPDLQAFARVLSTLPHGTRVPLEYYTFSERHRRKSSILQVDRQWYGTPLVWTRDDALGVWHHQALQQQQGAPPLLKDAAAAAAAAAAPVVNGETHQQQEQQQQEQPPGEMPAAAKQQPAAAGKAEGSSGASVHPIVLAARARMQKPAQHTATTADAGAGAALQVAAPAAAAAVAAVGRDSSPADSSGGLRDDVEESLKSCLVLVDVDIPLVALSDGVHSRSFAGNGLVVYHGDNLGLVLVSCFVYL